MKVVSGMLPLESLAFASVHEVNEESRRVGMLSMDWDSHIEEINPSDLLGSYMTYRRAALLIPVGVIMAAVKHHHGEFAAAHPVHRIAGYETADMLGEPHRVVLHVLVAQHVLGGELIKPGGERRGGDLTLPFGLEYLLHGVRDVIPLTRLELKVMPTTREAMRTAVPSGAIRLTFASEGAGRSRIEPQSIFLITPFLVPSATWLEVIKLISVLDGTPAAFSWVILSEHGGKIRTGRVLEL